MTREELNLWMLLIGGTGLVIVAVIALMIWDDWKWRNRK